MEQHVATQNNTIGSNISVNHHHHHDPTNNDASRTPPSMVVERRARPQKDQNLNCPRCNSTNTKFCYYNNYSLTQPRYFCKTCRRYWTQGGSLRNVPVGGGSRKNRRSSTSSSTNLAPSSSSSMNIPTIIPNKINPDLNPPSSFPHLITPSQNPKFLQGHDLNLGFPIQGFFQPLDQHQFSKIEASNNNNNNNSNENHEPINMMNGNIPNPSTTTSPCTTTSPPPSCGGNSGENNHNNSNSISALELLRSGIASKGSLSSFIPMPISDSNTLYPPSGFPNLQEVKQSNIGIFASQKPHHHHGNNGYEHIIGLGANARLLFPFVDMNKLANSTPNNHQQQHHEIEEHKERNNHHQHQHQHQHQAPTSGYWTGMLGGGTW